MPLNMEKRRAWTRAYTREVRAWRREHHICTLCGKRDAAIGFVRCSDCQQVQAERDEKYRDCKRRSDKRRYERRKSEGVCTVCGNPIDGSHRLCENCHKKKALRQRRNWLSKRIAPVRIDGQCVFCGERAVEGKKLCQRHYDSACANLVKARAALDKSKNYWHIREDNFHRNRFRKNSRGIAYGDL